MDDFFRYNKKKYGLSDEAIELLETKMKVIHVTKGDAFISQGDVNNYLYFVSTGLIRCWFAQEEKEITLSFAFEGELAMYPIDGHRHSPVTAVAIENSTLLRISQNQLDELFLNSNELAAWGYKTIKTMMSFLLNDYINLFWMNKKNCYMKLLEKHPNVLQRITLKDIASYLNITPSSLSRIRADVKL